MFLKPLKSFKKYGWIIRNFPMIQTCISVASWGHFVGKSFHDFQILGIEGEVEMGIFHYFQTFVPVSIFTNYSTKWKSKNTSHQFRWYIWWIQISYKKWGFQFKFFCLLRPSLNWVVSSISVSQKISKTYFLFSLSNV